MSDPVPESTSAPNEPPSQPHEKAAPPETPPEPVGASLTRLGLCLLGGVAADRFFFRGLSIGVSALLFTILYYVLTGWALRRRGQREPVPAFVWVLTAPILLLALTFALFANPILRAIDVALIPLLALLQAALATGWARRPWDRMGIIGDLAAMAGRGLGDMGPSLRAGASAIPAPEGFGRQAGKIALGLVLSVPLAILVLGLLTSADQIFARWLSDLWQRLLELDFFGLVRHGLAIFVAAAALSGWLWTMEKRRAPRLGVESASPANRIDPTVFSTILATVNVIYALFCVVQFSYLFGHGEGRLPAGFTYAEYARRGFFELTVATLLNMGLALIGLLFARREGGASEKILRGLLGLIVAQSAVILASAFYRLSLYEAAYGYTRARFFAQAMIVLMGLTLVFVFAWVWSERLPFWKLLLIAALADYIALNYANVDSRIARNNIDRYFASGKLDLAYLEGLSADALPAMTRLLEAKDAEIARAARAHLENWRSALAAPTPWHSINASKRRAARLLEEKL